MLSAAVASGAIMAWDDQWTPEEWRSWRAQQDAIRLAGVVPGEAAAWDDQWTADEWRIWNAMQEVPPLAGVAPDEAAAPTPPFVFYDEPGPAETPGSGSEPPFWAAFSATPEAAPEEPPRDLLLRSFAGRWNGPYAFVAEDWADVSACLQQHGVNLHPEAPARGLCTPWNNTAFWKSKCWWCG